MILEYDAYMRPVLDLGHCRFKGGGTQTTVQKREIPEQTMNEAVLESALTNYGLDMLTLLTGQNYNYTATPENNSTTVSGRKQNERINEYPGRGAAQASQWWDRAQNAIKNKKSTAKATTSKATTSKATTSTSAGGKGGAGNNSVTGKIAEALNNVYSPDWTALNNQYQRATDAALKDYTNATNTYNKSVSNASNTYKNALNSLANAYTKANNSNLSTYNKDVAGISDAMKNVTNGILPAAYAAARQQALNADLKGTVGNSIANLANRGIVNSSITQNSLNDISRNASDTLARNYADDLQQQMNLLTQREGTASNMYNTRNQAALGNYNVGSNKAENIYNSSTSTANSILNAANQLYGNRTLTAQNKLSGAASAQAGSYEPVQQYLNIGSQMLQPSMSMYNTMYSGRMGTGTVTSTTSSGGGKGSSGIASGVGSIGSALIVCFTGKTLITTPDGYKEIQDIQPGDIVLSVRDGEIVPKAVKEVMPPHKAQIVNVYFDNGTVWHTTPSQRYFDGKHFNFVECATTPAMVRGGKPSEIITYEFTGEEDWVYDFVVNGRAADNVYFANDVAAEGFGE